MIKISQILMCAVVLGIAGVASAQDSDMTIEKVRAASNGDLRVFFTSNLDVDCTNTNLVLFDNSDYNRNAASIALAALLAGKTVDVSASDSSGVCRGISLTIR